MLQVTLEEFKQAAHNQRRAIVFQEFHCDDITPTQAFLALKAGDGSVLLESAVKDEAMSRHSILAIDPFATFSSKGENATLQLQEKEENYRGEPFDRLRQTFHALRVTSCQQLPLLVGGAIGFMSYDAVRLFETVSSQHPDIHQVPDLFFLFHSIHIIFDHTKKSLIISINIACTEDSEKDYRAAVEKIQQIRVQLKTPVEKKVKKKRQPCVFAEDTTDEEYCVMVKKAKEHLAKGDIFQVVPSRTFSTPFDADAFDVYRALHAINPSPFMFYLQTSRFCLAGASPERLVKLENTTLQTMPIAGTCPRVLGRENQSVLALLQDPKEDAEHMMLVDLGRNDLGKIAKIGSVKVTELKVAKYFAHVIHLVSQVQAEIAEGFDAFDALKATFPAGTLSGTPKIRAMEIIDALENSRRGVYGGAVCTIDAQGNLDSCILIRTAFIQDGMAYVRAGGGVVIDSDPQKEADESRAKAQSVLNALSMAQEGVL